WRRWCLDDDFRRGRGRWSRRRRGATSEAQRRSAPNDEPSDRPGPTHPRPVTHGLLLRPVGGPFIPRRIGNGLKQGIDSLRQPLRGGGLPCPLVPHRLDALKVRSRQEQRIRRVVVKPLREFFFGVL